MLLVQVVAEVRVLMLLLLLLLLVVSLVELLLLQAQIAVCATVAHQRLPVNDR